MCSCVLKKAQRKTRRGYREVEPNVGKDKARKNLERSWYPLGPIDDYSSEGSSDNDYVNAWCTLRESPVLILDPRHDSTPVVLVRRTGCISAVSGGFWSRASTGAPIAGTYRLPMAVYSMGLRVSLPAYTLRGLSLPTSRWGAGGMGRYPSLVFRRYDRPGPFRLVR